MKQKVAVGSKNPVKVDAVRRAFSRFYDVEIKSLEVSSGTPPQPIGLEQTLNGAVGRARKACTYGDLGVGIEAGLIDMGKKLHFDIQVSAIHDGNSTTLGLGPGFLHPQQVIEEVLGGKEVGEIMEELSGIKAIGEKEGAIGFLTRGRVTRMEITEQSVLMALVPRIRGELYRW